MPPKTDTQKVDYRKFFYAFGVELSVGSQLQGDCPLCEHEAHFFVNPHTGQYDCKLCGEQGNAWTFLDKYHEHILKQTTDEDYTVLSRERGIKAATFKHLQLAKVPNQDKWIIPTNNPDGKLTNLYQMLPTESGGYMMMSSPAPCAQLPYRADTITKNIDTIWICEGQSDTAVWLEVMASLAPLGSDKHKLKGRPNFENGLLKTHAVIGAPGCNTFKKHWVKLLKDKHVNIMFDNDEAGRKGVDRIINMIAKSKDKPLSFQRLMWGENDPDKMDLRDILSSRNHLKTFYHVRDNLDPVELTEDVEDDSDEEIEQIEAVPCESFKELLETYNDELEMTENIEKTLACMIATVLSTTTYGGQLGLRVIGRPGSDKSTLAEAISCARDYVYPRSKFTGIVSGWASLKKSEQTAAKMNGMCVIVKDADTMLQLPNLRQIESEIRDALGDGVIRGEYRTGLEFEIETMFTMIQCGTKSLRGTDDSCLGSRFLDIVISDDDKSSSEHIVRRSINSQFSAITKALSKPNSDGGKINARKKGIEALGGPTKGLLQFVKQKLQDGITIKPITKKQETHFMAIAELISYCRAKVERSTQGHILYRPEKELATRLSEQFSRLGIFLAVLFLPANRKVVTLTKQVFEVLRKVMYDTADSFTFEILVTLFEFDRKNKTAKGMSKQDLASAIKISSTQTYAILQDMKELGLVETRHVSNPHGSGRHSHYFTLTKEVRKLCRLTLQ